MADDLFGRPGYSRTAFEDELLLLSDWLHRFARKLTRSTTSAQDLVQATYLLALAKADLYDPSQKLRSWLGTVMYNAHVSVHRKEVRSLFAIPAFFEANCAVHESFEEDIDTRRMFRKVARVVLSLPERQRDAIIGQHYLGLSHNDMVRIFSCPLGTVKGYIREGMRKVKEKLSTPDCASNAEGHTEIVIRSVPKDNPYYVLAETVRHICREVMN